MIEAAARPFFLFARQRSGTGALLSLLNAHPDCQALGEVFGDAYRDSDTHYFRWLPEAVRAEPGLIQPTRAAERLAAYLDFLRAGAVKPRLILDVKFSQTHHFEGYDMAPGAVPALFAHVRALGTPVIFLYRRNHLRAYLSSLSASMSGVWHARVGEDAALPKLVVEPEKLLKALRQRARQEARFDRIAALFPERTELTYETLFAPDGSLSAPAAAELEAALGVTGIRDLRTAQKKLLSGAISDLVDNADMVEKTLRDTKFAWMLKA